MKRTGRKKEWSIALFCFGLLAFFPPILTLFDRPVLLGGFPLTYLFLFGVWGLIILAMAISAKKRRRGQTGSPRYTGSENMTGEED